MKEEYKEATKQTCNKKTYFGEDLEIAELKLPIVDTLSPKCLIEEAIDFLKKKGVQAV